MVTPSRCQRSLAVQLESVEIVADRLQPFYAEAVAGESAGWDSGIDAESHVP